MKNAVPILMISCAACAAAAQGFLRHNIASNKSIGDDAVVAVVEDRAITKAEVMREVEPFIPQIRAASNSEFEFNSRVNAYVGDILQNMIDRELIVKDFEKKGMSIPMSYLDTYFDDYLKREFSGDRAELMRYVREQGKTIKQFREEQRKEIIVNYMRGNMRQTVAEISPKKISEYYEKNRQRWFSPASVKIRMITLKTTVSMSLEANRKLAAQIMEKIAGGADFAELAKTYSKDDSAVKGGEWGWYKKGQLNPQLDKAVFAVPAGGTTKPIELGDMIFILKVEQTRPEGVREIDDVREEIEFAIADANSKAAYQKWIEGLRAKAYIKIYQ